MFGDCLFFSADRYVMTCARTVYTYEMEISDDQIVTAWNLADDDIQADLASYFDCSEEQAIEMLTTGVVPESLDSGDGDWYVQRKQGECARAMGFVACKETDEQGVVYIVSMSGKLSDLTLVDVTHA